MTTHRAPGDYVHDDDLAWITAEMIERIKEEQQQLDARCEMEEELDELRLQQGLEASRNPVFDISSDDSDSD